VPLLVAVDGAIRTTYKHINLVIFGRIHRLPHQVVMRAPGAAESGRSVEFQTQRKLFRHVRVHVHRPRGETAKPLYWARLMERERPMLR
jgi:hypothetical protein